MELNLQVMEATSEDVKSSRPVSQETIAIKAVVDSLNVMQKINLPNSKKPMVQAYVKEKFHDVVGNERFYRCKTIDKDKSFALIRIK